MFGEIIASDLEFLFSIILEETQFWLMGACSYGIVVIL
jgi:hypothetical protein